MMGWYAVYSREMLLLYKKMGKFGYVFSSALYPVIYLFAFGLGLGGRMPVGGSDYVPFLAKGILGLTVMLNSFQQTSLSASMTRLHFKTFQTLILSPVPAFSTGVGIVMAGITRGIFMGMLVYMLACIFFSVPYLLPVNLIGLFLSALCFSAVGLVIGLWVSDPDEISLFNNFIITPMIFFCGSFFPLQNLPPLVQSVVAVLPLSLANDLLRAPAWEPGLMITTGALLCLGICPLSVGVYMLTRYSE